MSDLDRIEAAIDCPQEQLLILADIHEEECRLHLANGYRILARENRWPGYTRKAWRWVPTATVAWTSKCHPYRFPVDVPMTVWEFPTASSALRAGALAIAHWFLGMRLGIFDKENLGEYEIRCGPHVICTITMTDVSTWVHDRNVAIESWFQKNPLEE